MSFYGAHNVKMNPQSDCTTPTKKQIKALYQAQRRANPVERRLEQSSDTEDHESEQRAAAREVPGV
jgi:Spy/CpxP family protein refolding chaperone